MQEKLTIGILREHLDDYSAHLQKFASESSASNDSLQLFDELAKYHHYMFSEIIDYLEQNQ